MDFFMKNVVRLHGFLEDVTSDRGPQFISHLFLHTFGTFVDLSTVHHPQTYGQTERVNQTFEQYLWYAVSYQQDDQVDFLAIVELA